MDEAWLPKGKLDHLWYYGHLMSWVVMVAVIAGHLLMNAQAGGLPLLLSMCNTKFRAKDAPQLWPKNVLIWWHKNRQLSWLEMFYALA